MRRLLIALFTLWPLAVSAQVLPAPGSGAPLFGYPAPQGSSSNPFTNVVFTGQALGPLGTDCSAPAYSATADTNTGIEIRATPSIVDCVNGTAVTTTTASAVTSTVPILAPDGTAGAPSYSFTADSTLGFFRAGTQRIGVTANGNTERWRFDGANNAFLQVGALEWGANLNSMDVSLSRGAANRLDLASGDSFMVGASVGINGSSPATNNLAVKATGTAFGISLHNSASADGNSIAGLLQESTGGGIVYVRPSGGGSTNSVQLAGETGRVTATGGYAVAAMAISGTAPTIASGGCTSPTITEANGTAAFTVTIGTSCTGVKTVTLTMPAADNLWACRGENNTSDAAQQTNYIVSRATSTTAVVLTSYDRVTGLQEDFTASDVYLVACVGSGS